MGAARSRGDARRRARVPMAGLLAVLVAWSGALSPSAKATSANATSDQADAQSVPAGVSMRDKADFVFFSYYVFSNPDTRAAYLDYIKRFRVCLTNGYTNFTGQDLADIKASGCRLFVYRWFNGYYAEELLGTGYYSAYPEVTAAWREVNSHPDWLVNPVVPLAGSGAVLPAYFFDWANPEMRAFYIDYLVRQLQATGYDGVFFDYIGDWALPDPVLQLWTVKNPGMTYNEAGALFLRELRAALGPDRPIMGNQAYRLDNSHDYYQSLTYDVTESYGTASVWGKQADIYDEYQGSVKAQETYYRPWDGWNGYKALMESGTIGPALKLAGASTRFHPIDYVQPRYLATGETIDLGNGPTPVFRRVDDKPAIHYSYALAKLYNVDAYASDWASWLGDSRTFGGDEVYFSDLGAPLEASYRQAPDTVVRYFENGFVVVTRTNRHDNQVTPTNGPTGSAEALSFTPDPAMIPAAATGLFDVYHGALVADWSPTASPSASAVEIKPERYDTTGSYYPSGRVYLYQRG
jgi:hypothetical protein